MKYLTQQDIDYLVNQSTDRINITLAGMTALMKDTDANIEAWNLNLGISVCLTRY